MFGCSLLGRLIGESFLVSSGIIDAKKVKFITLSSPGSYSYSRSPSEVLELVAIVRREAPTITLTAPAVSCEAHASAVDQKHRCYRREGYTPRLCFPPVHTSEVSAIAAKVTPAVERGDMCIRRWRRDTRHFLLLRQPPPPRNDAQHVA